ncbi:SET domain-containing protein [Trametes elegans]|nr:SET domain-containing protein [Trametes elegans]
MNMDAFLSWLRKTGVRLHDGITIVASPGAGVSVVSNRDEPIFHPETVASIPKTAILSARNCAAAQYIHWVPYGHGATLALSLALYSEILKGGESSWHSYLQTLPPDPVPIARLWGDATFTEDLDGQSAARWIHGTEIEKELQDEDGSPLMDETRTFYKFEVQPLLDATGAQPTLQGFLHAYSLVCSRAFLVDAYHGLSMVPVADAFNHTHNNHVQLASEFDVCPLCGSLTECPHDRDDSTPPHANPDTHTDTPAPHGAGPTDTDTVDMVTVRSIAPRAEVFNTYGADLGNAALLARYGFALDGTEADAVTFGWSGSGIVLEHDQDQEIFRSVYAQARENAVAGIVKGVSLVYVPPADDYGGQRLLAVNSDGQASLGLFVWAAWHALSERPPLELQGASDSHVLAALPQYLPRLAETLVQIEAFRDEEDDAQELDISDDFACHLLEGAAEALASLCRTRITGMGQKGYRGACAEALGEVLDNLPPENKKTKLALEYLLSERALLEACAVGWEELRRTIADGSDVDSGSDSDTEACD